MFIKQNSLLINQITQRETTTIKLQAGYIFPPTTIGYFSNDVIPNNNNAMSQCHHKQARSQGEDMGECPPVID